MPARSRSGQAALPQMVCACASLRRAARAVTQAYESELRRVGLTSPQFTILHVLTHRGESSQGALSEFLATDTTTLTRTLKLMADRGWISSRPDDADGRVRLWTIAPQGRSRFQRGVPRWEAAQGKLKRRLGDSEWTRLLKDLTTVASSAR